MNFALKRNFSRFSTFASKLSKPLPEYTKPLIDVLSCNFCLKQLSRENMKLLLPEMSQQTYQDQDICLIRNNLLVFMKANLSYTITK